MRKTLQKQNFRQTPFDLGQLEPLELWRTFQDWAQLGSNLYGKYSIVFFMKMI